MSLDKYDPEWLYVVIQHGGSTGEHYIHTFDTLGEAEEYRVSCEEASYDSEEPEATRRWPHEQVSPLLYEMLRWLHETGHLGDTSPQVRGEIEALLRHVREGNDALPVALAATAQWWREKGMPWMGRPAIKEQS